MLSKNASGRAAALEACPASVVLRASCQHPGQLRFERLGPSSLPSDCRAGDYPVGPC